SLPEGLTVGGYLDLRGTQITSLPEGLTVGDYLDLRGTQITSLPEGLTVGGYLDLRGTQITSLPEGLTVGGYLDLRGTQITDTSNVNRVVPEPLLREWRGRKFIQADGIFQQLIERKGNVCHVKNIGSDKITYLVTDGNGKWAHGETIKEAKDDLIYKISDRDKSKYESWTTQTEVSFEEAIEAYRVITGACAAGTKGFVSSLPQLKDRYTIAEVIELTKGQYGHDEFVKFFNANTK
ncbi:MAG: hypothetical protein IJF63_04785, partial [Alistipes sp.]|nr:hypothetical protein [Alistipes sp.]